MGRRREDIVSLFVASAVCARSAVACAAALLFELTTIVNFFCGESSAEPLRSYLILGALHLRSRTPHE